MSKYIKLANSLTDSWNKCDYRDLKESLVVDAQKSLMKFKRINNKEYKDNYIQVIDLFCGAGGTSLGFAAINEILPVFRFLGGCDINAVSASTYSYNFDTPLLNDNVVEFAYSHEKLNKTLERIGYDKNKPLILIGCAPCQGFSSHRKKDWDKKDDSRNSLIIAFSKIVEEINPDVILMENVPEFLSDKYWEYFSAAKQNFERAGYLVKQNIYNAASFGVPQRRKRYVVVGVRKDLNRKYIKPSVSTTKITVRDAIGYLPVPPEDGKDHINYPLHRRDKLSDLNIKRINALKEGQGRDDLPKELLANCHKIGSDIIGYRNVYGRMAWDDVAPTITARFDSFTRGKFGHPDQPRSISLREGALLQTFPEDFDFVGSKVDIARQIGNAVPPVLAEAIGKSIVATYEGEF